MRTQWSKVARWRAGVPATLVALLWVVLWQAWPTTPSAAGSRRSPAASCVVYRGLIERGSVQLAFVQAPSVPGSLIEMENPEALRVPAADSPGRSLERNGSAVGATSAEISGLVSTDAESVAVFRPLFDAPRVFDFHPARGGVFVVDMSNRLRERDFKVAALTAEELQWTNAAWQVALRVECGEDGAVEDVFVESGTTNQAFNLALARRVQAGGKAMPGARCAGEVIVSYGEE